MDSKTTLRDTKKPGSTTVTSSIMTGTMSLTLPCTRGVTFSSNSPCSTITVTAYITVRLGLPSVRIPAEVLRLTFDGDIITFGFLRELMFSNRYETSYC